MLEFYFFFMLIKKAELDQVVIGVGLCFKIGFVFPFPFFYHGGKEAFGQV